MENIKRKPFSIINGVTTKLFLEIRYIHFKTQTRTSIETGDWSNGQAAQVSEIPSASDLGKAGRAIAAELGDWNGNFRKKPYVYLGSRLTWVDMLYFLK